MPEPVDQCAQVREILPELAMAVASGEARALALAHLVTCADCRTQLEETTELVDERLLLAPEQEPPAGFEGRVLTAIQRTIPRRQRRASWLAAALVVAVAAVGLTRWADSDDRHLAAEYRHALQVAGGTHLSAAHLTDDRGTGVGEVFAYAGHPSWVFMTVDDAPSRDYAVTLVTRDGRTMAIGECSVRDGWGSWGTTVDAGSDAIDRIEMRAEDGTTFTADFPTTG
jgi:hypothetical protein